MILTDGAEHLPAHRRHAHRGKTSVNGNWFGVDVAAVLIKPELEGLVWESMNAPLHPDMVNLHHSRAVESVFDDNANFVGPEGIKVRKYGNRTKMTMV